MRLLPIRVALKTQSLEEWFWRLVFVGVVRLPLYGMVYCEIATRTPRLRVIKAGTEGGQGNKKKHLRAELLPFRETFFVKLSDALA